MTTIQFGLKLGFESVSLGGKQRNNKKANFFVNKIEINKETIKRPTFLSKFKEKFQNKQYFFLVKGLND